MPELTDLQQSLLNVLNEFSDQNLFANKTCKMSNPQLMAKMKIKPNVESYVGRILKSLQTKGKVKIEFKQGKKGLERIVTLL